MPKLILHIPHSSTRFPNKDGFDLSAAELDFEIRTLTDWHTEDLFQTKDSIRVVAHFCRLFCDVERFEDNQVETMAKFGMGMLYEKTDCGKTMRKVTPEIRAYISKEYYHPHHKKLNAAVKEQLDDCGIALIVDCHSFPDHPHQRDLNKEQPRPDICIGADNYHTPQVLIDFAVSFFENKGLRVAINKPYAGSMVPRDYYQKDKRVQSIMVEVNKKLYVVPDSLEKTRGYNTIKNIISEFLTQLKAQIENEYSG